MYVGMLRTLSLDILLHLMIVVERKKKNNIPVIKFVDIMFGKVKMQRN